MSYALFFSTLSLVGGLAILPLGLVILRENPRAAVNRATALMLFSGALGSMLGALGRLLELPDAVVGSSAVWLRSFSYLWEFFFPSLLYFALVYPAAAVRRRQLHAVEAALYVPYLCHLALVLLTGEAGLGDQAVDVITARAGSGHMGDFVAGTLEMLSFLVRLLGQIHQQIFALVNVSYAALAIYLLRRSGARVQSARVRGQLRIIVVGLTLCVVGYALAKIIPIFRYNTPSDVLVVVLTSLSLLLATGTIGWAIVRHKFLDMRNLARRSILYGATAVLFAGFYIVVMKQVARLTAGVFGPNADVIEAGFIVVTVLVFQPLLVGAEEALESFLRRRGIDPQAQLQELARQLGSEVEVGALRARVAASLRHSLFVEGAALYTLESHDGIATLDGGERRAALHPASPVGALVGFFESGREPALRQDVERSLSALSPPQRAELHAWIGEHALLVPIVRQDTLVGLLGVGPKLSGARFHAEDVGLLALVAQQIGASLDNLRLVSENLQKRVMEDELQLAAQIQKNLLPTVFPCGRGYSTHALSLASKEVGGDYYDVFVLEDRLYVAIADVSGKGVPAALLMASLRAALRSNVQHLSSPAQVLERINDLLFESTSPEKFATFFFGLLDLRTHELVFANAGHNYPMILRADGAVEELTQGGLVLGIFPGTRYTDGEARLGDGDLLFLYTDGVTEASNAQEEEYGTERLLGLLQQSLDRTAEQVVADVLGAVRSFASASDPGDDITMLAVRRAAGAA